MKHLQQLASILFFSVIAQGASAYTYLTCANGNQLNFNSGYMTFNYANNLTSAQKSAISTGLSRVTAFSDSSISTNDNSDSSFSLGNGQNEIYIADIDTADCSVWFNTTTCTVVEADIRFGNEPWTTDDNSQHAPYAAGRSMTGTSVHEGGHCIGMAHSNDVYNMMGSDWNHVTRNGTTTYYGPGEDLSAGLIALHGEKSTTDANRDVGITVLRYLGASGEYSTHRFGELQDGSGATLPTVGSYEGQSTYQVIAGTTIQMELTMENNGEPDTESPTVGLYLSANSIISTDDTLISNLTGYTLERDTPLETTVALSIPIGTPSGNYFLGAYIDQNDLLSETTSANNIAYYPVTIVEPPPAVTTATATAINTTQATLNGSINPNGGSTTVSFDWGKTTTYSNTVTSGVIGAGTIPVGVHTTVSGLTCGTLYHFRARAVNGGGTTYGIDRTLTTAACTGGC